MNVEEAIEAITSEKIIIHRGQVLFNTRDEAEARRWAERGARIVPWFDEEQIAARKAKPWRPPLPQGWEVHLLGAVERVWEEDENGDQKDMTRELLLLTAREAVA